MRKSAPREPAWARCSMASRRNSAPRSSSITSKIGRPDEESQLGRRGGIGYSQSAGEGGSGRIFSVHHGERGGRLGRVALACPASRASRGGGGRGPTPRGAARGGGPAQR